MSDFATPAGVPQGHRARFGLRALATLTFLFLLAAGPARAASYKVGSFTKTTAGAPAGQSVAHGLGEVPKALILWTNGKTNESFSPDAFYGFGVSDGTTSASVSTSMTNGLATFHTGNAYASGAVLTIFDGAAGTTRAQAAFTSWDATNFVLNWTTNDGIPYVVHFIAIGGTEVSAKVVEWNRATTLGNQAVAVGFQPDVVIHGEADMTSPNTGPKGVVVLGAADGSGGQWAHSIYSSEPSPAPTDTQRGQATADCFYWVYNGTVAHRATCTMTPTGYTVNHTVNDGWAAQTFTLALKGMQARVANFAKTSGAPVVQTVATGIRPRMVLLSGIQYQGTGASGVQAEARFGIGASDGTNEGSSAFQGQDNQNPSNVDGIDKTSKVFVKVDNATPTINAEADMLGFSENSFILDWTTNDPTTTRIFYLALGDITTYVRSIGTAANYTQGSVSVTRGSTTVTGTGGTPPDWVAANRGRGDRITITGQGTYTVLGVTSPTSLTLTAPFTGTSGTYTYSIARNFTGPEAWYNCVDGSSACTPAGGANLVTTRRKEVGVMYKEGHAAFTGDTWDSATTSATYDITLTADPPNRHYGIFGTGAVFDNGGNSMRPYNAYMTFEWLEFRNGAPRIFHINNNGSPNKLTVRYCLFDSTADEPMNWFGPHDADVYNNIFWGSSDALDIDSSTVNVYNNTFYNLSGSAVVAASSTVTLRNNVALGCSGNCYSVSTLVGTSSNNIASDTAALTTHSPAGGGLRGIVATANPTTCSDTDGCVGFQSLGSPPNLHLISTTYTNQAVDSGVNLGASIPALDIDRGARTGTWDRGADELGAATAVKLARFSARGYDQAALVEWHTASELDNLGFHLYRATTAAGPWTRLNASRIPGLGSSPEGKTYAWADRGLTNGVTYYYRLEDVDRSGVVTSHGPVSAVPAAGVPPPEDAAASEDSEEPLQPSPDVRWTAHGDPFDLSLRELQRTARGVTLELRTGGFYSLALPDGTVRLRVPGFFDTAEPGLPSVPVKRAWIDAVVGRGARVVSVRVGELGYFPGLPPQPAGAPEARARRDGTYRASFRRVRAKDPLGLHPASAARILELAFQAEAKKAYLELAPLRFDGPGHRLVLAQRLVVTIAFDGRVEGESGADGSRGRRQPRLRGRPAAKPNEDAKPGQEAEAILARIGARASGLQAVSWESLSAAAPQAAHAGHTLPTSSLRLSRLGQAVAFHVEPRADRFGPGSTMYFIADGPDAAYGNETVYELAVASGGLQMSVGRSPGTAAAWLVPALVTTRSFEQNTNYLPGLLNARDLWLWDIGLLAGNARDYAFSLSTPLATAGPAALAVDLQGGSEAASVDPDHAVRILVNGVPVGEASFDGLDPFRFEASLDASILVDGTNTLRLENLDTTGRFDSVVYLDRFTLEYPRQLLAEAGRLEGRARSSGIVRAAGLSAGALLLDVTGKVPSWLSPLPTGGELVFTAESGKSYLAVSPEAVLRPEVRPATAPLLRSASHQADWIVIAPKELLPAAEPLVVHRESQGLKAVAVALEQVQDEFGYGERSPQALRDFLAYAYHHWAQPSPRYVLLLGDASYDPKGYLPTAARKDLLPTPLVKSTFLWTASDPWLAAVNGDDAIPDLAIGRLSAGSLAEAEAAVQKILAFEAGGQRLDGNAVLVADNPDKAGDFEANANDIASLLGGRKVDRIFLTQLGSTTRSAVLGAFDAGASLVSYVGHGSQSLWASESILRSIDVPLLKPQPRQPLMLTMTCSNGYFISPWMNGLSERFVLEADKGAIAAFSPSGLSLDEAAHLYHRALVLELQSGRHERLGDLVLGAQTAYADTGAFPELLSIYHLFADPALRIQ
jgi:hypothetical protein